MSAVHTVKELSDREFRTLQQLIYQEAGIHLSDAKKALVTGRLSRRVRALGLNDFTAYCEHLQGSEDEKTTMLDCIATNETRFFREPKQFEFLEADVLPKWKACGEAGTMPKRTIEFLLPAFG